MPGRSRYLAEGVSIHAVPVCRTRFNTVCAARPARDTTRGGFSLLPRRTPDQYCPAIPAIRRAESALYALERQDGDDSYERY